MKTRRSSNFGQIRPPTTELAALERQKKSPHRLTAAFTYYYDPILLLNKLTPLSIFTDLALRK